MTTQATSDVQEEQLCEALLWRTESLCPYYLPFIIIWGALCILGDLVSLANE